MKKLVIMMMLLAGCATQQLPKHPMMEPSAAVNYLAKQDALVKTVAGEGSVTLTRKDGQSVRLDTAMAAQFPEHVRLRSWKMGQAVFDLTLSPDGVWMLVADPKRREKILPAGANAANFLRGWSMLHDGFYIDPKLKIVDVTPDRFYLERPTPEGTIIRAEIQRDTLTIRRHSVLDEKRIERFSLDYDKYKVIDGIVWPTRMRARGDQGEILVEMDEVLLNTPPATNAFVPPKRAEKLP